MADAFVQLAVDGAGKMMDTTSLTVSAQTVHRQRINHADPTDAAGLAKVRNVLPVAGDYGLVTRAIPPYATRADTFTAGANGTTLDVSGAPMRAYALAVKKTGSVTSWTVVLEASLDNTNWTTVLTATDVTPGDGAIIWSGAQAFPVLYLRARCAAITLGAGTNVISTIVGVC